MATTSRAIRWQVVRTPDGYAGKFILPANGNDPDTGKRVRQMTVTSKPVPVLPGTKPGQAKSQALNNAAALAGKLLDNPVVSALLPPGIGPALKGVRMLVGNPKLRAAIKEGGKMAFRALMRKLS